MNKKLLIIIILIPILLLIGAGIWLAIPLSADSTAAEALADTEYVTYEKNDWHTFAPKDLEYTTGFILYPGARIDPVAYAPLAAEIARNGYLVVIVPMPVNLAILGGNQADDVTAAYPEIDTWVIGGHSLGGVMAASYADSHASINGLILLASAPGPGTDLSDNFIQVSSVYATNDLVFTVDQALAPADVLPDDTDYIQIAGGNHAYFARISGMPGDGEASITPEEQQTAVAGAVVDLLYEVAAE